MATLLDELKRFAETTDNPSSANFANSLIFNFNRYGSLTEKQRTAAQRMLERAANPVKPATVDMEGFQKFRKLFDVARENNLKRPKIRLEGLTVKLAAWTGRNPGYLYAFSDTEEAYIGKISPEGQWTPANTTDQATSTAALKAFANFGHDPAGAARAYGQQTGMCCFCGRELTDGRSIVVGYGPICAEKYGLPWGEATTPTTVEVAIGAAPVPVKRGRKAPSYVKHLPDNSDTVNVPAKRGRGRPRKTV